jgi:hypothetical protein
MYVNTDICYLIFQKCRIITKFHRNLKKKPKRIWGKTVEVVLAGS